MNFLDVHKKQLEAATKKRMDLNLQTPVDIPKGFLFNVQIAKQHYMKKYLKKINMCVQYVKIILELMRKHVLEYTVDEGSFEAMFQNILSTNPLHMPGYEENSYKQKTTQINEAFVCGKASIVGYPCAIGILDSHFMMGSMGSVVGESNTFN